MTTKRFAKARLESGRAAWLEVRDDHAVVLNNAPWLGGEETSERVESEGLKLLAPAEPRKIVCIGRNYKAHAKELGNEVPKEPLLFMKPSTSLLDPEGAVELPPSSISERVEHEGEIAAVVGERLRRVDPKAALAGVFGLTLALDITARDLQKKDGQWTRAKGMDTFCPTGPYLVTGLDLPSLTLTLKVNGQQRQHGHARDMVFGLGELISYISRVMTLEPGDLILTGTPEGVGPLAPGDVIEHAVDEIGTLRVSVVAAPAG